MKMNLFCYSIIASVLTTSLASAQLLRIQTFDTQPAFEEPEPRIDPLPEGTWGVQQDGLNNVDEIAEPPVLITPFWNSGGGGGSGGSDGWLTTVGTETSINNRGAIGGANYEGIPTTAILTNLFTGALIYDNGSWGDVSNATHMTMDVKGSFAGSGGISFYVHGEEGGTLWSWTAAVSNEAVGANPGDVTEWTTLRIPINKPSKRKDASVFPSVVGTEGYIEGSLEEGGNWGVNGNYASDAEMVARWDLAMSNVTRIDVRGLTPDSQIDNLGFVLPSVGTPGDFDLDEDVDGADFLAWQRDFGGTYDADDLTDWQTNYGTAAAVASLSAVPEPPAIALTLLAGCGLLGIRQKREP